MSLGLQATKRRMNSVSSTRKMTNAMHLVATAKFKTWKNKMEKTNDYANELMTLFSQLSESLSQEQFNEYFATSNIKQKSLCIIVTSSLGLCAGYNYNLFKLCKEEINDSDELVVIGSKGVNYFTRNGYKVNQEFANLFQDFNYMSIKKLASYVLSRVRLNEVSNVKLVYTKFKNSISFIPTIEMIYPLKKVENHVSLTKKEMNVLIEPDVKTVLQYLVPLYFESLLYGRLIEANVSENACRRNAMESATDNADDIISKLQIDYNKARQQAITQEITEIVGGANAQK